VKKNGHRVPPWQGVVKKIEKKILVRTLGENITSKIF
jgi:hypothetical protein